MPSVGSFVNFRRGSSGHDRSGPRNRGDLAQSGNHSRSERDLTKVTKVRVRPVNNTPGAASAAAAQQQQSSEPKSRGKMKTTTMIINSSSADDNNSGNWPVDVVRAPLNAQLVESTSVALQQAADNLVQLYKRISLDHDLEEETRTRFLERLAGSAGTAAVQTLRPVLPNQEQQQHQRPQQHVSQPEEKSKQ